MELIEFKEQKKFVNGFMILLIILQSQYNNYYFLYKYDNY